MKKKRNHVLNKERLIKLGVLLLIIFAAAIFFLRNQVLFEAVLDGDIGYIRAEMADNKWGVSILMLAVMIVQNTFTLIPLILVITVNIALFGFLYGFLWSWITSVIAAVIIFYIVRFFFQDRLLHYISPHHIKNLEEKGYVYVFQARIFPFIPTSLINIAGGISSIKGYSFFYATLLGNFIYFFILALIPAGILSSSMGEIGIGVIFLSGLLLYYGIRKRRSRKKEITEKED